ncbi:hypothetical protein D3C71_2140930 [compost metagenome]
MSEAGRIVSSCNPFHESVYLTDILTFLATLNRSSVLTLIIAEAPTTVYEATDTSVEFTGTSLETALLDGTSAIFL